MTLYTALVTISKCAAPMVPFMTEEIYLNLVKSIAKDCLIAVNAAQIFLDTAELLAVFRPDRTKLRLGSFGRMKR